MSPQRARDYQFHVDATHFSHRRPLHRLPGLLTPGEADRGGRWCDVQAIIAAVTALAAGHADPGSPDRGASPVQGGLPPLRSTRSGR
jgi:hypothetical protein